MIGATDREEYARLAAREFLRGLYAIAASRPLSCQPDLKAHLAAIPRQAWEFADAMLAARGQAMKGTSHG